MGIWERVAEFQKLDSAGNVWGTAQSPMWMENRVVCAWPGERRRKEPKAWLGRWALSAALSEPPSPPHIPT